MNLNGHQNQKVKMDNLKVYSKLEEIRDLMFINTIINLSKSGLTQSSIAKVLKVSKSTVNSILKETKFDKEN